MRKDKIAGHSENPVSDPHTRPIRSQAGIPPRRQVLIFEIECAQADPPSHFEIRAAAKRNIGETAGCVAISSGTRHWVGPGSSANSLPAPWHRVKLAKFAAVAPWVQSGNCPGGRSICCPERCSDPG